jgi:hypothetical protein
MSKRLSKPSAVAKADAERAYNLALLAGHRKPTKKTCDELALILKFFSYFIIETAVYGTVTDQDIFEAIASGPVAAAEIFKAARQRGLPLLAKRTVEIFMDRIGFKYPEPDAAPEDAAIGLPRRWIMPSRRLTKKWR